MSYREKKNLLRSGRRRNWKAQDKRRESASERKMLSDKRTVADRIERLDNGGFAAVKERTKLSKEA